MSESIKWHRHLGAYGICNINNQLLVVHKIGGPYINRFDLPGGSIEPHETIIEAVYREFKEETGVEVSVKGQIGIRDYVVPWRRPDYDHTHCHHIAIYYEVDFLGGDLSDSYSPEVIDTNGAAWISLDQITLDNSSPLILEAVEWIKTKRFPLEAEQYNDWIVRNTRSHEES